MIAKYGVDGANASGYTVLETAALAMNGMQLGGYTKNLFVGSYVTHAAGNYENAVVAGENGKTLKMDLQFFAEGSSSGLKINQLPLAKPGEDLYVGTYSKSSYWNKKTGLNKTHTPHHVVQDAVSSVSHGKGITINIRKDIHLNTETYGSLRTSLTNRQHLAADIAELRVLLKEQGYSRSTINAQLNELIKQNKALGDFEK